jgi:hypothetical protein
MNEKNPDAEPKPMLPVVATALGIPAGTSLWEWPRKPLGKPTGKSSPGGKGVASKGSRGQTNRGAVRGQSRGYFKSTNRGKKAPWGFS